MAYPPQGVGRHTSLLEKEVAGVIDHADDSVTLDKILDGIDLSDIEIKARPRYEVGLDANKPTSPALGDTYLTTDTGIVYNCYSAGTWTASGGTLGSPATIAGAEPILYLEETDQTAPAGLWRKRLQVDVLYWERALAAGWTSDEDWLKFDKANEMITFGKNVTFSDDITLGVNKVKFTNYLLMEYGGGVAIRNVSNTDYRELLLRALYPRSGIYYQLGTGYFRADGATGAYVTFEAQDTGVGLVEVARLQGAADPSFKIGNNGNVMVGTYAGLVGFFAATPVSQRLKANYNDWAALGDVVDALVALGLFDQA